MGRAWASVRSVLGAYPDFSLAAVALAAVGMMIIPLPTALIDLLISLNLSVAVLLVLVAIYVPGSTGFASLPALLLVHTLFRLALNISTTRSILLRADAGRVIAAFGDFVVQGNYIVGAVVFLVITLVQFIVITKGAERVAEVAARFALDSLPGKQLAIDSDLKSGALSLREAGIKRRDLEQTSQFYGAMDGAMKFVKGDAIAGLAITAINVCAGVLVGVTSFELSASESARLFGVLTIGDGLVTQVPALLVATAAGILVTRIDSQADEGSLARNVQRHMFGDKRILAAAAFFIACLALVPGLPALPFMVVAGGFAALAYSDRLAVSRLLPLGLGRSQPPSGISALRGPGEHSSSAHQLTVECPVTVLQRLSEATLAMIDRGVRLETQRLRSGLEPPSVHFRADAGRAGERVRVRLDGRLLRSDQSDDPAEIGAALREVVRTEAAVLFDSECTMRLLEATRAKHATATAVVGPGRLTPAVLTGILRRLVAGRIPLEPLHEILDHVALRPGTLASSESVLADTAIDELRRGLSHRISARFAPSGELAAVRLEPDVEDVLRSSLVQTPNGARFALDPELELGLVVALQRASAHFKPDEDCVVIAPADLRTALEATLLTRAPKFVALSALELSSETQLAWRMRLGLHELAQHA